jgi:hypothetical protein
MKPQVLEEDKQAILKSLQDILNTQKNLSTEEKTCGLFCYYRYRGKRKKLLFYLNPRIKEVVFGISHRGTDILEKFPMFTIMADETRTSVMKFSIKKLEDIDKKAIKKIIELIVDSE